jgi:hypothetical protein
LRSAGLLRGEFALAGLPAGRVLDSRPPRGIVPLERDDGAWAGVQRCLEALRHYTRLHLEVVNDRLDHSGAIIALG